MHKPTTGRTDEITSSSIGVDECADTVLPFPQPLDSCSPEILLDQFYQNVNFYLNHLQRYQISEVRNEVYEKMKNRALFQSKVFGKSSSNFDVLPQNSFSSFIVSLHLVLRDTSYVFFSSLPGLEIHENYDDQGRFILHYISRGHLPPNSLEVLKKMNLKWYDGGLICQIEDTRRKNMNIIRILLRVNQSDVARIGTNHESSFLLARYPYLSFDNDIQVSRVARLASNNKSRWQTDRKETPKDFIQVTYPSLLIETPHGTSAIETETETENVGNEDLNLLFEKIAKLAED